MPRAWKVVLHWWAVCGRPTACRPAAWAPISAARSATAAVDRAIDSPLVVTAVSTNGESRLARPTVAVHDLAVIFAPHGAGGHAVGHAASACQCSTSFHALVAACHSSPRVGATHSCVDRGDLFVSKGRALKPWRQSRCADRGIEFEG